MIKKVAICVISIQVLAIFLLISHIFNKKKNVLGTAVVPISKNEIISSPSSNLKYFYEPKTNNLTSVDKYIFTQNTSLYSINSDSLNERYDYSPQKSEGTFRIITLGDSVTFGLFNKTKDNWTELLEDKLNSEMKCSNIKKFEVINLSVPGYDTKYIAERYKKRGIKYNPNLVIWLHVDLLRDDEELIPIIQSIVDKANNEKKNVEKFPFADARAMVINKLTEEKILEENGVAIHSLSDYFNGNVIMIPYPVTLKSEYKLWLEKITKYRKNWYYFDGIRDIQKLRGLIMNDGHPNIEGHKMIAEDIYNYLKTKNFMQCEHSL